MEDPATMAAIVGLGVNFITLIVGGVWAVGKISRQTAVLDNSIEHLSRSIEQLTASITRIDGRIDDHSSRITRLESDVQMMKSETDRLEARVSTQAGFVGKLLLKNGESADLGDLG